MNDAPETTPAPGGPVRFDAIVGGRSRIPRFLVVVVALVLGAAVAHPWDLLLRGLTTAPAVSQPARDGVVPTSVAARADAPPTSGADTAATRRAVEAICLEPGTWRTATIEQWHADQTVRVWRALELRSASGPTDPGIDVVPAVGESVPAIGYCAPTTGPGRPTGAASVAAWRRDGDKATPIDLRQVAPVDAVSALGALFGPPDAADAGWPSGVYVFRFAEVAAGAEARWFAVEVRAAGPVTSRVAAPRLPPSEVMQAGGGQGAFFLP